MVPCALDAHFCECAASVHRVRFKRVDRSHSVFRGAVFCEEKMVAITGDDHCGRAWWDVAQRVGEDRRSSTTSLFTWLGCRLVGIQLCQRTYHRGDLALRPAC